MYDKTLCALFYDAASAFDVIYYSVIILGGSHKLLRWRSFLRSFS